MTCEVTAGAAPHGCIGQPTPANPTSVHSNLPVPLAAGAGLARFRPLQVAPPTERLMMTPPDEQGGFSLAEIGK